MRVNFSEFFRYTPEGLIEVKQDVNVNGHTYEVGHTFGRTDSLMGVHIHKLSGRDLEIEPLIYKITGTYSSKEN
jgi:hypothetical protein